MTGALQIVMTQCLLLNSVMMVLSTQVLQCLVVCHVWGNWERQGKDKIMLTTTKIFTNSGNYKIPDPKIITVFSESKIQVGNTVYKRN